MNRHTDIKRQSKMKLRKQQVKRQKFLIGVIAVCLTLILSVKSAAFSSAAQDNEQTDHYKYYKTIEIHKGDTLWDIARKYKTDEYDSVQDYIDEIKQINNLKDHNIQAGNYLIIAYYEPEFK